MTLRLHLLDCLQRKQTESLGRAAVMNRVCLDVSNQPGLVDHRRCDGEFWHTATGGVDLMNSGQDLDLGHFRQVGLEDAAVLGVFDLRHLAPGQLEVLGESGVVVNVCGGASDRLVGEARDEWV